MTNKSPVQWFRFYVEAMDDPKILDLTDRQFRAWVLLMAFAGKNGGTFQERHVRHALRISESDASALIEELVGLGLMDRLNDQELEPHNWGERQFKTDSSNAERQRRWREKQKSNADRNVTRDVTVTGQETETETEKNRTLLSDDNRATASAAPAAPVVFDPKKRLFDEAIPLLRDCGKTMGLSRALIGKWLKTCKNDISLVTRIVMETKAERPIDPIGWIEACIQNRLREKAEKEIKHPVTRGLKLKPARIVPLNRL